MTWRSSTSTLWEVIYHYDLAADLQRLPPRIPMLCLHGDRDTSAPLDRVMELARTRLNCKVRVLHGVGHDPLLSQPERVVEEIAAVLPVLHTAA